MGRESEVDLSELTPVLEISGLVKHYSGEGGDVKVLKGVNCSVFPGEIVAVTGASGVGKSTFLHVAGTLDTPSSGRVLHFGKDVFSWSDDRISAFRNRAIGFLFQFHHLLPEFSALENVMMPALLAGVSAGDAQNDAGELLDLLGLSHRRHHMISHLSGGEQQRVALARAMIRKPGLLLADEPTGNLDEATGGRVAELLFSMKEMYGTAVVVVTHDNSLASRMDRRFHLVDGKMEEG
jgi:lipoprotein-releasing system ATP-binding protein